MSQYYWKASSIDHLTDARFFNAIEDAWIEFAFDVLTPRSVTIEQAKSIIEWLFEPQMLASFGIHQTAEEIDYVLTETGITYAAIPFEHELAQDEDFSSIAFLKITRNDLRAALDMPNPPFAFVVDFRDQITETDIPILEKLLEYSKVFVQLPEDISNIKALLSPLETIGIEIPTEPESSPGLGAVDIYDQIIDALES